MPDVSFTELAGRRVLLRRFRPQDVAEFVAYRSRGGGPLSRLSTWAKGEWTDDLLYALLHDEWQALST
jgi:hypothetical protein